MHTPPLDIPGGEFLFNSHLQRLLRASTARTCGNPLRAILCSHTALDGYLDCQLLMFLPCTNLSTILTSLAHALVAFLRQSDALLCAFEASCVLHTLARGGGRGSEFSSVVHSSFSWTWRRRGAGAHWKRATRTRVYCLWGRV